MLKFAIDDGVGPEDLRNPSWEFCLEDIKSVDITFCHLPRLRTI